MTSTESVPEVKHITIPEPPALPGDHPKPLARRFWKSIVDTVTEAREYAKVIYAYRVAEANETELLRTGESPAVVAYRQAKQRRDENVTAIKAECEAKCQPFYDERDAAIKEQDKALTEAEGKARKELNTDSGVTGEDLVSALEEYKASAEIVKDWVAKLNKQIPTPYVYSMPSMDGKRSASGTRGFTPRFGSITVNDQPLTDDDGEPITKLADLAEWLGTQTGKTVIRDDVRDTMLAQSLNDDEAVWKALDAESAVSFVWDYQDMDKPENSKKFHITVTKAQGPNKGANKAEGETEAPDDDDDESSDE